MDKEFRITGRNTDPFNWNRNIAYKGSIGKEREDFCISHIKHKKAVFERIQQEISDLTKHQGKKFTCHKGCAYCCVLYIEADLKECEAIVYYLYHNDDVLSIFLEQYPIWRQKTGRYGDILKKLEQAFYEMRNEQNAAGNQLEDLAETLLDYQWLNVPCPFLHDNICLIYEVRPYVCATHYVTSPAQWCSPLGRFEPDIYRSKTKDDMPARSFYHQQLGEPIVSSMPLLVYGILGGGFSHLANVTGLKSLEEVTND
jgi:Fe-S-cluster containining protein